jgi:hypothetical protein
LLVSATTTSGFQSSSSESGTIAYAAGGIASNSPSNDVAGVFNRLGTDGIIVQLKKDGTTVGSIGTYTSLPYIGKSDVTLLFDPSGPHMIPRGTNGGARDAAINLGASTNRFKDLYLSGGVYEGYSYVGTKVKTGSSSVSFTLSCSPQASLWRHGYILITCSARANGSTGADCIYALYECQADLTNSYPTSLNFKDHIGSSMTDFNISLSSGVLTVADNSATWDNMICRIEFGMFTGNVGIS